MLLRISPSRNYRKDGLHVQSAVLMKIAPLTVLTACFNQTNMFTNSIKNMCFFE